MSFLPFCGILPLNDITASGFVTLSASPSTSGVRPPPEHGAGLIIRQGASETMNYFRDKIRTSLLTKPARLGPRVKWGAVILGSVIMGLLLITYTWETLILGLFIAAVLLLERDE